MVVVSGVEMMFSISWAATSWKSGFGSGVERDATLESCCGAAPVREVTMERPLSRSDLHAPDASGTDEAVSCRTAASAGNPVGAGSAPAMLSPGASAAEGTVGKGKITLVGSVRAGELEDMSSGSGSRL